MLPAVISREIEAGIKSFLRSTFPPATPAFQHTLESFLDEPGRVFKGPYYALKLPFRPAPPVPLPFESITFPYRPHLHQARAFARLCGEKPKSTLVATGTGSGKTECFLFPILDLCAAQAGQPGIKAIVIYPMNALASDQARRFAQSIHADEKLRGKVTAGLYIGGEGDQTTAMTADGVITHKGHLQENPPDILLTNYKMLDYLLLRPDEQRLWRNNSPETLRYLVVDELHTFDGAQSTDLACLIRRLKARLRTPENQLCCVGTSATLGSSGSMDPLIKYARTVFSEPFEGDCVIGEDLLTLGDVVEGFYIRFHGVPDPGNHLLSSSEANGNAGAYLATQYQLWFGKAAPAPLDSDEARMDLGEHLREHSFFRNLLLMVEHSGRRIISDTWMLHELGRMDPAWADPLMGKPLLDSFLSLCTHARYCGPGGGKPGPLLRVHVHLWMRELSRLVASVDATPHMAFSDDLKAEALNNHLPVIHCRDCGTMGWGGTMQANDERIAPGLQDFYKAFFGQLPTLRLIFPDQGRKEDGPGQGEFTHRICGHCLTINAADAKVCQSCSAEDRLVNVLVRDRVRRRKDQTEAEISCPCCDSASGLTILGSRAASLTSVALGQIYASPFNKDKQALAFSDNVQDASHRAGFFAARTYRVNLRTAIRRVITDAGGEISLSELEARFPAFWKKQLGDIDFTGLFLAPDMEWLDDYAMLKDDGRLPTGSNLTRLVERRLAWEIISEFGFFSRIGRTLEKSGAGIAFPKPERVEEAGWHLAARLKERAGGFGSVTEPELRVLLAGLLNRLRTLGGIMHPELDLYVNGAGNTYLHNNQLVHMPGFGPTGRAPSFFYQGTARIQRFERLVGGGTSPSWCQSWAMKALKSVPGLSTESAGLVIEEAVRAMTEAGLLVERTVHDTRIWGLQPEFLRIASEVTALTCSHCGHAAACAQAEIAYWENAPCLRLSCAGTYAAQPTIRDYFGDLYRAGDVERIRAAEHTGLLDRKDRDHLEKRFMARGADRRATDPNLLSCTPTLEMGVNIGDLSTVVLCTVPPATASYVQRVGRAGRAEGAAVSLTIASTQPHDLYYFEMPEDMMAGDIYPPGTFLDAPAVLERQFTAFCLDRWSEQTPPPLLPKKIEVVLDVVREPEKKKGFPFDFFDFVEARLDYLLTAFLGLFHENELAPESRALLTRFGRGDGGEEGGLTERLLRRLSRLAEERDDLRKRMTKVGSAIRKNREIQARDDALDGELDELQQNRDGIFEMLKQINSKPTLNYFTDEGLLPNYAFPEEGVELRSVILKTRKKPAADEGRYQALTFEYVRPSSSAITELAPGNTFYVEGRRLKIDQVGLNVSPIETWHFCDACGYMERLSDTSPIRTECPTCGSPNWADGSLKRELVRLRQVVSTSIDRSSRVRDDKDQREHEFYNRCESIVIPEDTERQAYQIRDTEVPFGFEFLAKSTLRVVNLGQDDAAATAFRIAGREVHTGGFALCPDCGKVQPRRSARGEEELKHDISCRRRGATDTTPLKAVFLYRELQSEAIRVLLPSTGTSDEVAMSSFVAALHLGLRLHFGGNIDHLRGCVDERPVPGTSLHRKYLVLYDQVPGGTGYLKQLSQKPSDFLDILRKALKHLQECTCATRDDHDTDGCHRCILQARHRRDHANLSRETAIHLLTAILEHSDKLEQVKKVTDIDIHPLIKSELEKTFLESLRAEPGAQLQRKIVRGKPGYLWRRGDTAWEISLQVAVPADHGVDTPSIPDFVLYPVRPTMSRPIAVFLDGRMFHADEATGHNRIALDVRQRQALLRSGHYWVWSFSWEDVQHRNDPAKIPQTLMGEENASYRNEHLAPSLFGSEDLALARSLCSFTSWSLLLEFLVRPTEVFWTRVSYSYALALPGTLRPVELELASETIRLLAEIPIGAPKLPESKSPDGLGGTYLDSAKSAASVTLATLAGVRERDPAGLFLRLCFDDHTACRDADFPRHWRGFLRLMNRLQFLPHAPIITVRGCQQGAFTNGSEEYAYFRAGGQASRPASLPSKNTNADDLDLAHPAIRTTLMQLPRPFLGYEWMDGDRVVAMAEAAWPDAKCAILPDEATPDLELFRQAGWTVFTFTSSGLTTEALNQLRSLLGRNP